MPLESNFQQILLEKLGLFRSKWNPLRAYVLDLKNTIEKLIVTVHKSKCDVGPEIDSRL